MLSWFRRKTRNWDDVAVTDKERVVRNREIFVRTLVQLTEHVSRLKQECTSVLLIADSMYQRFNGDTSLHQEELVLESVRRFKRYEIALLLLADYREFWKSKALKLINDEQDRSLVGLPLDRNKVFGDYITTDMTAVIQDATNTAQAAVDGQDGVLSQYYGALGASQVPSEVSSKVHGDNQFWYSYVTKRATEVREEQRLAAERREEAKRLEAEARKSELDNKEAAPVTAQQPDGVNAPKRVEESQHQSTNEKSVSLPVAPPSISQVREQSSMSDAKQPLITKNFLIHLARGGIKIIPLVGALIDEMIFGALEGEAKAAESQKLANTLTAIQGRLDSQSATVEELLIKTTAEGGFTPQISQGINQLAAALKSPDALPSAPAVESAVASLLTRHGVSLSEAEHDPRAVVQRLEQATLQVTPAQQMDRLQFTKWLYGLVDDDLTAILLNIPNSHGRVTANASVRRRVNELIEWVDSSTGPGLNKVFQTAQAVDLFPQ